MRKLAFNIILLMWLLPTPAYAYIGPGVGAGAIAVVLGVLASIFLAFVGILWYPIKRLIKRRKASSKKPEEETPLASE